MSDNRGPTPAPGPGIFSAADIKRQMAEIEAAKAAEEMRRLQAQEEQQKAVMAEFQRPPARTAEQLLPLIMQLVSGAAERGQTEVQVYRFPNTMCTDRGRRINNAEPDWPQTLRGGPRPDINSGAITCGRSALAWRLKSSNIRATCPAKSALLLLGHRGLPFRQIGVESRWMGVG